MVTAVDLLSGLGSISSLLGLGLQIKGLGGSEEKNVISLRSFEAITSVAFRWKHVHNRYHLLLNDVGHINNFCITTKKDDISDAKIRSLLSNIRTLEQKAPNFRRDLDVYISAEVRKVAEGGDFETAIDDVESKFGPEISVKVRQTFNSQKDVIRAHDATCDILDSIVPMIGGRGVKPPSLKLYTSIVPLYKSFNQVILHTDEILINTIDLYGIIFGPGAKW